MLLFHSLILILAVITFILVIFVGIRYLYKILTTNNDFFPIKNVFNQPIIKALKKM
jgi:hypothetical protein